MSESTRAHNERDAAEEERASEVSEEQAAMERTIEAFDTSMDDRPLDDVPPDEGGFADWLEDEGIFSGKDQ